jgi:hypothetical protein
MPGAFPLTLCLIQEPATPHNENTLDGYEYIQDPEKSSPVKGIKEEHDYDFLA